MADAGIGSTSIQQNLDIATPAAAEAQLGQSLFGVINAFNAFLVKYNAFLAHLDTANVAGIGNGNTAAYGASSLTVGLPGTYPSPY